MKRMDRLGRGDQARGGRGGYGRWRWVHGLLGLGAGLILGIQGLTGALLAYEREIRDMLGEGRVEVAGERLDPRSLVERLRERRWGGDPVWLIWKADPGEPVWIRWRGGESGAGASYLANPYTGVVLEGSTAVHRIFEGVLGIHRRLGAGRFGQVVTGTSALVLASLLVTGLVLQYRRTRGLRGFLGYPGGRASGGWRWWHAVLGTWTAPFLLIMALTGPVWSFAAYRALIGWITYSDPQYGAQPAVLDGAMAETNLEAVLAAVEPLVPAHGAMRLVLPAGPGRPARFEWAPEGALYENFRSRVYLDPATGEVLAEEPLAGYTRAEFLVRLAYPLHIGAWGGPVTQFLHALSALVLVFLSASGAWLYLQRTRKPQPEKE